ncbi:MAG: hypothetical protein HXY34_05885 [Candidatus Thorarchaeota archaeon]|nr:hypothetical protein [Candidatus Thorarchaeota archaeon]
MLILRIPGALITPRRCASLSKSVDLHAGAYRRELCIERSVLTEVRSRGSAEREVFPVVLVATPDSQSVLYVVAVSVRASPVFPAESPVSDLVSRNPVGVVPLGSVVVMATLRS